MEKKIINKEVLFAKHYGKTQVQATVDSIPVLLMRTKNEPSNVKNETQMILSTH